MPEDMCGGALMQEWFVSLTGFGINWQRPETVYCMALVLALKAFLVKFISLCGWEEDGHFETPSCPSGAHPSNKFSQRTLGPVVDQD